MVKAKIKKLSIITASHQNLDGLAALKTQIQPALGDQINWIIKDSACCDSSLQWGNHLNDHNIHFFSSPDSGIYSALNYALEQSASEFYLVVGSDDSLNTESLFNVSAMLRTDSFDNLDVISFPVIINGNIFRKKRMRPIWVSIGGLISSHSVGTIIRRELHSSIGKYQEEFKILADALFLRQAYQSGAKFKNFNFPVIGSFSTHGVSSTQHARRILEAYSYNVSCGDSPALQAFLMMLRTLKNKPLKFI
jgi:hypothetical protein